MKRPVSPRRRGAPRPLAAYLGATILGVREAVANAPKAGAEPFEWRPSLRGAVDDVAAAFEDTQDSDVTDAVARAGLGMLTRAVAGVETYQRARELKRPKKPRVAAQFGSARLLAFDPVNAAPDAPALVAAPSLINRSTILDLTRARSLMRGLRDRGVRAYLIDWGEPQGEERRFDVADYVERRLRPALAAAREETGGPVALLGHCLGGALAAAAAQRAPETVSGLILLAAPWSYAALKPPQAQEPALLAELIETCGTAFGGVPPDLLNTLFFMRDPLQAMRKFPRLTSAARNRTEGRVFVAVEDWVNDGVRMAAPAARDVFVDWIFRDRLAQGDWTVGGDAIDLRRMDRPTLVVASKKDGLTPHASALAAYEIAPNASLLEPRGGHVGMIVGAGARAELWDPLADWVKRHAVQDGRTMTTSASRRTRRAPNAA